MKLASKINELKWAIWKPKTGFFSTPNHSFPLFLPDEGYVTILNAAYQIVAFSRSTLPLKDIHYCVRVIYDGFDYALRVSKNIAILYTTEHGVGASLELIPWPRNSKNLYISIRNIIKLLKVYNVHDS